jgi:hypothetical protein
MHLKVFVKLKKTLETLSSGQKNPKKTKKTQKNPLGWFFFLKTRVFSNPASNIFFNDVKKLQICLYCQVGCL